MNIMFLFKLLLRLLWLEIGVNDPELLFLVRYKLIMAWSPIAMAEGEVKHYAHWKKLVWFSNYILKYEKARLVI